MQNKIVAAFMAWEQFCNISNLAIGDEAIDLLINDHPEQRKYQTKETLRFKNSGKLYTFTDIEEAKKVYNPMRKKIFEEYKAKHYIPC
jgi:hypothetical protein